MPQVSEAEELDFLEQHKGEVGFETNFAVKKFLELQPDAQEALFEKVNSEEIEERTEAAKTLLDFVLENLEEMGRFVSEAIDTWIIWPRDYQPKAVYLLLYFKHHLRKNPDGTFAIEPMS
jgi:hypothetical protein